AQKACRDGYTALFLKAAELFRDLAVAHADGSHSKVLDRLGRVDLLIVDDWPWPYLPNRNAAISWRSATRDTRREPRCLPVNCPSRVGTRRLAIPPSPTVSLTGSSTMHTGS